MASKLCRHGRSICAECVKVDDTAKRAFDTITDIVLATDYDERVKQFPYVAISLQTGGSDGKMYDTRRRAIRHQLHEQQCAYFSFREMPGGFASPRDAAIFLVWHRRAYDAGMRMVDPDDRNGGPELIMPTPNEHLHSQLRRMR